MQTDYIIVGQGICGTLLSWCLMKEGKSVVVIDEPQPFTAGKVASGLINPVTGMRVVKSWMIDELLPEAMAMYYEIGRRFDAKIINPCSVLEFYPDIKYRDAFAERATQYPEYLHTDVDSADWEAMFNFHYGIGRISSTAIINMRLLQARWREHLRTVGWLIEEKFDQSKLIATPEKVTYKGITAEKIIFCDGAAGLDNPYFSRLPFSLNKGEILLASIPDLPRQFVYKHGLKIAPWENDLFWIGSSFEWTFDNLDTSAAFREKTEWQLKNWLKLPFTIEDQWASVRPATVDHKPFAGFHPLHPSVGILNGMGAKGCSQAPYFAQSLASHLVHDTPMHKEADVSRYTKVLSK